MKLLSVNVGLPRSVVWQGREVSTGIFKQPVEGEVRLDRLNLAGDGQADLRVHGGVDKAVYAYPWEHYGYWRGILGRDDLAPGGFGENFTVAGMAETRVRVGDVFRVGTALLQVSQPRTPCWKLSLRFGIDDFHARFSLSRRVGFYLRVLEPGGVAAGMLIALVDSDPDAPSVAELFDLKLDPRPDPVQLRRAADAPALSAGWRESFRKRL
ncbi:MAG TPA: MOSC domain-containing protein [Acidiferrobacterales bacterium]